jgi:NADH-quinone oxidoreductase subunit C
VGRSIDFATIYVPADKLVDTCRALRDTPSLAFNAIIEITAADYLPHEPRYEVVYHLLSVPNRARVRLKVRVAGSAADEGVVPTVQSIWPVPAGPSAKCGTCSGSSSPATRTCGAADAGGLGGPPARKDYPVQIRKRRRPTSRWK